jgi:hypothetical protein
MQIRELSKPVTANVLNESLAKKFGYKLNLEQFTEAQLEDARNKLRTKMSQFEVSESFDSIKSNNSYQKTKLMLDCINQEIMEREEGKCKDCGHTPCDCDHDKEVDESQADKKENFRKEVQKAKLKHKAEEHSVPESWINSALQRIDLNEADEAELIAELTTRYDLSEGQAYSIVYLSEGEEEKAKVIMATKDMVERITGWLEDTAQMKAEQLLELMDSIRETLGSDVAQKYEQSVKPALESVYTALEQSRTGLTAGLAIVSGKEAPMMGSDASMGGAPDLGAPPAPSELGGEMPAPEMGAEGPDMAGREKRESVDYSRRLGILLAQSKKK